MKIFILEKKICLRISVGKINLGILIIFKSKNFNISKNIDFELFA